MIYADNAATTKMSPRALQVMLDVAQNAWGNPSSLYELGQAAQETLMDARGRMARILGAEAKEIYFTSGGSEGDNQAIRSCVRLGAAKNKRHIVSTAFEHHAVLHTLKRLEKEGCEITYLPVHENGIVTPEEVKAAIQPDTCLVTIMFANNEIGTIQPIQEIGAVCRAAKVPFHTDAVQAAGHVRIDVKEMNIDLLSLSAHKFHGPRGVGALYCRTGLPLYPLIEGGAQERNRRAGTENVAGICAMVTALEEMVANLDRNGAYVRNFCFEGIEGESLLLLLDQAGICASSGSACTSGSLDPSHVLLAIGRPHEVAHGSLRLTLSEENTEADVDEILKEVPRIVEYLRGFSPIWQDLVSGRRAHML